MILDCDSYSSARQSICQIFGVSDGGLVEFLTHLDLDELYESREAADIWTDDALISALETKFQCEAVPFEKVAWFHLTRINKTSAAFAEGILPLSKSLENIWKLLISISGDAERSANLTTLKAARVPDRLYQLKAGSELPNAAAMVSQLPPTAFNAGTLGAVGTFLAYAAGTGNPFTPPKPSYYSQPDCRLVPNTGVTVNGTIQYTGQTSSNPAIPGTDSRGAGAPVASGTYPQNNRAPGTFGPNE
jgi:hypothetical protein